MSTPENENTNFCPDGHRCQNGGVCEEIPGDEGSYQCDCDEEGQDAAYAGLYCEHKATTYCVNDQTDQIPSKTSFCTNGGTCTKMVDDDDHIHYDCDCTTNYEGSHCQFVRGSKPESYDWPSDGNGIGGEAYTTTSGVAMGPLAIAIIVVVTVVILLGVFIVVKKGLQKSRSPSQTEVYSATEDLSFTDDASLGQRAEGVSLPAAEEIKGEVKNRSTVHHVIDDEDDNEII